MTPFSYSRASTLSDANSQLNAKLASSSFEKGEDKFQADVQPIGGGTTLIDLMKLNVMQPEQLVDINQLRSEANIKTVASDEKGLTLSAFATMSEVAENETVLRDYPMIAQSLQLAASQQIRNMATIGGNILQRTRCAYFRDTSFNQCNKRSPGSGCAAIPGDSRALAILGTSQDCIATHPGDFSQSMAALDAIISISGKNGKRTILFSALHKMPGSSPNIETTLQPDELIVSLNIPAAPWTKRSIYLKIRDRASYAFALASAAIALDMSDGTIKNARIALGGVGTVPWRSTDAEQALKDKAPNEQNFRAAAEAAFKTAKTTEKNAFKQELGKRTLIRALTQVAAMEIK